MRTPKAGDKCEHAEYDSKLGKNVRTCPVLHMAGKPPGQLVARIQDRWTILVCSAHAMHLEAPNVRKQRKPKVVAEQIDLVEAAKLIGASFELDAAMATTVSCSEDMVTLANLQQIEDQLKLFIVDDPWPSPELEAKRREHYRAMKMPEGEP